MRRKRHTPQEIIAKLREADFPLGDRNRGRRKGRAPKLLKVRHGDAPMRHCAVRIEFCDAPKCILGGGVSERVKQRNPSVELLLNRGQAGNRKRNFSQLLRRAVTVRLLRG